MIQLQPLNLQQREKIQNAFSIKGRETCSYSAVNIYLWGKQLCGWVEDNFVVLTQDRGRPAYLFPVGTGDLGRTISLMMEDAAQRGNRFAMTALTEEDCKVLEELLPGRLCFFPDRDNWDYLHEIRNLTQLRGRGFQQKRSRINRFLEAVPDWHLEIVGRENLCLCRRFFCNWYESRKKENPELDFGPEQDALSRAMDHYDDLGLDGLLLLNGETPIGFSAGSLLKPDLFDIHFEKADSAVPGAYAMLSRTFAEHIQEKYPLVRYINREEDMGLPGLRESKLSYRPDRMAEQYRCIYKGDNA